MKRFVKAIQGALAAYDIEGWVAQTDLKPLTVLAVDHLLPAGRTDLVLWANEMRTNEWRKRVVDEQLEHAKHENFEVLVDVHVLKGKQDPFETLVTAESEGCSAHGNALGSLENDFAWDPDELAEIRRIESVAVLEQMKTWLGHQPHQDRGVLSGVTFIRGSR